MTFLLVGVDCSGLVSLHGAIDVGIWCVISSIIVG